MTYFQRGALAIACILLGYFFWPLVIFGGLIAWSVYSDLAAEPANQKQAEEANARARALLTAEDMQSRCESPAEVAFLKSMVSSYDLKAGPGRIEGRGLRLRNQVAIGQLNVYSGFATSQYRADFLIDEKLVVEIDGTAYHFSPEALERDKQRDEVMRREGYVVLRIPASMAMVNRTQALRLVEDARQLAAASGNTGSDRS